jgi:GTP-binding protein HflX
MIDTEKDNRKLVERAILIGIYDNKEVFENEIDEHLEELTELVKNLNIPVIAEKVIKLRKYNTRYMIGKGKAQEIADLAQAMEADCLIFDSDLSPSQQRNWEALTKICVIDRQEVILDIFASRATTREANLQVQLARMQYSMPRLTRAWTHLGRQQGGAKGTRGEGEKQLEIDRRLIQHKITSLKKEIIEVGKRRATQRKSRERNEIPHAAIVGYTNAGKSSLLNKLADSDVGVEDKLFATLDPTTRKISLPNKLPLLLTDTVGFVRKLPHNLVEAFNSTLEEAVLADFLIIVIDVSSSHIYDHWETTTSVLKKLGARDKPMVLVFNKIDLQKDKAVLKQLDEEFENKIFLSTYDGTGIEELQNILIEYVSKKANIIQLIIPPARSDLIALAHAKGVVLESEFLDNADTKMSINIGSDYIKLFKGFIVNR